MLWLRRCGRTMRYQVAVGEGNEKHFRKAAQAGESCCRASKRSPARLVVERHLEVVSTPAEEPPGLLSLMPAALCPSFSASSAEREAVVPLQYYLIPASGGGVY